MSTNEGPGAGSRSRLEFDEIDDGDLDRVAPLTIEAGGGGDDLFDLVDLGGDCVSRRLAAERGGEGGAVDQHGDGEILDHEAGAGRLNRLRRDFVVCQLLALLRLVVRLLRIRRPSLRLRKIGLDACGLLSSRVLRALLLLGDAHRPLDTAVGIVDGLVRLRLVGVEPGRDRDLKILGAEVRRQRAADVLADLLRHFLFEREQIVRRLLDRTGRRRPRGCRRR